MFFLIDKQNYGILDCVSKKNMIYKMLLTYFRKELKGPMRHVMNFDIVEIHDIGYCFTKKDNDIEIRKYYINEGYLYNTLMYEEIGEYIIVEFKKQFQNFDSLIEDIKNIKK